ncbi:MAG: hypothetical protein KDJ29_21350 [Hyphomicrobiales bacterium]|nr:hypothetical protein [Hyphomicrobiales bacterium]
MKALATGGRYVAFTSELDAAPEIMNGMVRFLHIQDSDVLPQSVSVAVDGRKAESALTKFVAECAANAALGIVKDVRERMASG